MDTSEFITSLIAGQSILKRNLFTFNSNEMNNRWFFYAVTPLLLNYGGEKVWLDGDASPVSREKNMFSKRTQCQPGALTLYGLRLPGNEICTTLVTGSYILVRERHTEPALNLSIWLQAKMDYLLSASKSFFVCVPMLLLRPPPGMSTPKTSNIV